LEDALIENYYLDHFESLSKRQLDKEFVYDLKVLSQALSKLTDSERKAFVSVLSSVIDFYLEHMIEKEIDYSFKKIFKF
jgi:hypothetical protein